MNLSQLYVPPWSGFFDLFCGAVCVAVGVIPFMWICGVFHYVGR